MIGHAFRFLPLSGVHPDGTRLLMHLRTVPVALEIRCPIESAFRNRRSVAGYCIDTCTFIRIGIFWADRS